MVTFADVYKRQILENGKLYRKEKNGKLVSRIMGCLLYTSLSSVDISSVESISVLKDASATAVYGAVSYTHLVAVVGAFFGDSIEARFHIRLYRVVANKKS